MSAVPHQPDNLMRFVGFDDQKADGNDSKMVQTAFDAVQTIKTNEEQMLSRPKLKRRC